MSERSGVDPAVFRETMACFATGVTVITTVHDGRNLGITANAVASVSLDPVLLLVCVDNRLWTRTALQESRRFVVNVLHEGQEPLARRFASKVPDRFAGVALDQDHDLPVIADSLAHFVCDVHEVFPGGDHSIFTGRVLDCKANRHSRPLLFYRSSFGSLEPPAEMHAYTSGLGGIH
jgi:3-hydroxy-9,10-secoandrosta-1,3,5(10)-triene-9,17-dione monooxygenase reductase component